MVTSTGQKYLTSTEAAKFIGVHPNTLRGYADQNLIEHVRLPGGHRRFERVHLEAFVARLRDRTISEPTEEQISALSREYGQ